MVVVFMMDRQFVELFAGKFAPAPGAYPGKDLERSVPVSIASPFPKLPRFGKDAFQFAAIRFGLL